MANYTPNLNLRKPLTGEYYDVIADHNDAMEKIDTAIGNNTSQLAQIPNQTYITEKAKQTDVNAATRISGNRFVRALGTRLAQGYEKACIAIFGDSTGNANDEWAYLTMQWLMTKIPRYRFIYRSWSPDLQAYDAGTVVQVGTGTQDVNGVKIPLGAFNFISTPHKAEQTITGDLDVRIKVSADNWGLGQMLISKFGAAGQRGWAFGILPNKVPYIWISPDGTNNSTLSASTPLDVPVNVPIWLRVVLGVDDGAGNHIATFYTSENGVTWTQFGIQIVVAGTTSLFATSAPIEIFSRSGGNSENFGGMFYEAEVRNGFNGAIVANPKVKVDGATFTDSYLNTWTINGTYEMDFVRVLYILNASSPGMNLAYSADTVRFDKQLPMEPQLAFISYSHNEGANINYQAEYEAFCSQILAKYPNAGIVCVTQNPQKAPEVNIVPHAIRCRQIAQVASKNDYGLVDAHRAFIETGNPEAYNMDGAHPNALGSQLWADQVINFLKPATN